MRQQTSIWRVGPFGVGVPRRGLGRALRAPELLRCGLVVAPAVSGIGVRGLGSLHECFNITSKTHLCSNFIAKKWGEKLLSPCGFFVAPAVWGSGVRGLGSQDVCKGARFPVEGEWCVFIS